MFKLFQIAWQSPREAVQYVNQHAFKAYWLVLLLAGFGNIVLSSINRQTGALSWSSIIVALVFAIPILWILAAVAGFFTHFIAKWLFKGTGTFTAMRKGYYVSFLPYVIAGPVAIIYIIIEKAATFNMSSILMIVSLIALVLNIVTLVLEVIVISEVENLSIGRSIGVIVVLMILIVIIVVVIIIVMTMILLLLGFKA